MWELCNNVVVSRDLRLLSSRARILPKVVTTGRRVTNFALRPPTASWSFLHVFGFLEDMLQTHDMLHLGFHVKALTCRVTARASGRVP